MKQFATSDERRLFGMTAAATRAPRNRLRFVLTTAEGHPTHRADVRVLFGKCLPETGIDTDLLAVTTGDAPADWSGGRLLTTPAGSKAGFFLADVRQQLSLFRLGALRQYDGFIVRDKPILGIIGWAAARITRTRFIYWMSFPLPEAYLAIALSPSGKSGPLRRVYAWFRGIAGSLFLYYFLARRADYLFVQSERMLAYLRGKGIAHERISAVPMGVDLDAMLRGEPLAGETEERAATAVYLGTLNRLRRKELEVMIDAAVEVSRAIPGFVLLVIGESESAAEQGWLQRYARERGGESCVRFTGWVPPEEGLRLASRARIGISPISRGPLFDMGSPTKAIEYMALGLPVVCNDQPDQAQVVRDSGAGLCVALQASAFAGAVRELLADPARAHAMGEAGRRWVARNRSYRLLAGDVARVLRSLCSRSFVATRDRPPIDAREKRIG